MVSAGPCTSEFNMTYALVLLMAVMGQEKQALAYPPLKLYRHNCKIVDTYDEFTDKGFYSVELGRAVTAGRTEYTLQAKHDYFSKRLRPPDLAHVELVLTMLSDKQLSPFVGDSLQGKDRGCQFLFEKGRIQTAYPRHSHLTIRKSDYRKRDPGLYAHSYSVKASMREFLDIVNSQRVRGRIHGNEFTLTEEQQEGLRDYAARLAFDADVANAKLEQLRAVEDPARRGRERQAEAKLRRADDLLKAGKKAAANALYKDIIRSVPDSPQANTAADRLRSGLRKK